MESQNSFDKPFTFDRVIRISITVLIMIGLFFAVKHLQGALIPFAIAWLVSYLMFPLVKFYQYKLRMKFRILAVIASLITVIGSIVGVISLLVGPVSEEVTHMGELVRVYASTNVDMAFLPDAWEAWLREYFASPDFQDFLNKQDWGQYAEAILAESWKFFNNSLSFVLSFLIIAVILLYTVFISLDYEVLSKGWKRLLPEKQRGLVIELANDIEIGMNRYFRGQALIATIVGVLFATGFAIIGLPMGIILGIFLGFLNLVPYLQTVGFIPLAFMALLKTLETGDSFGMVFLTVFGVFVIVQGFQEVFLIPRIQGKNMGLNPAIILLSLSVWGSLLGLLGMIIALPATTIIVSYYRRFILHENNKAFADEESSEVVNVEEVE